MARRRSFSPEFKPKPSAWSWRARAPSRPWPGSPTWTSPSWSVRSSPLPMSSTAT